MDSLRYWVTEMHVDGFRFDLASTLARELFAVDRLSAFFDLVQQDPVVSPGEADRRAVGRRRGRLPGRQLPAAVVGVERPLPRHDPRLLARRAGDARRVRLALHRQLRPVPGRHPAPDRIGQLRHRPRRVHARRPGVVQRQAQRGQRRGQPRRRVAQPLVELRRRRRATDRRPGDHRPARPPAAQLRRPRCCCRRACRCCSAATSSAAPSSGNNNAYCQDNELSWFDWDDADADVRSSGAGRSSRCAATTPCSVAVAGSRATRSAARGGRLAAPRRGGDDRRRLGQRLRQVARRPPQRRRRSRPRRVRRPDRRRLVPACCSTPASSTCRGRCPPTRCGPREPWMVELDSALALEPGTEYGADSPRHVDRPSPLRPRPVVARRIGRDHDGRRPAARRAGELGVETSYWDVDGHVPRDATSRRCASVVEVLEADTRRSAPSRLDPVDRRPARRASRRRRRRPGAAGARRRHRRSTLPVVDEHVHDPAIALPIGCHGCRSTGAGIDESSTIVVAPAAMPPSATARRQRRPVRAGLRAVGARVAAAVASATSRRSARRCPGSAPTCSSTLPLYAAFLDEPFDPSPYAPVSRLHWNEVYLDDAVAARGADLTAAVGELIDWRTLARRRRRATARRPPRDARSRTVAAGIDAWWPTRPDVADYARFRATDRPDPTDAGRPAALVEAQPPPRPVPRRRPAGRRRVRRVGGARPRPADRQPPGRLRDVGPPRPVRHRR